jgi:HJR/Mrr/RecB family endonuclease
MAAILLAGVKARLDQLRALRRQWVQDQRQLDEERIEIEAAEWVTQTCAGVRRYNTAKFLEWILRSPTHVEEFIRLSQIYGEIGHVSQLRDDVRPLREAAASEDGTHKTSQIIALPSAKIVAEVNSGLYVANERITHWLKRQQGSVFDLSARQFEILVAELLEDQGWQVQITPASHDGGTDIYAQYNLGATQVLCLVDAKRYRQDRRVGVEIVRALYGTLKLSNATHGMIVTTSAFTSAAKELQRKHAYELALHDYLTLMQWIQRYRGRQAAET